MQKINLKTQKTKSMLGLLIIILMTLTSMPIINQTNATPESYIVYGIVFYENETTAEFISVNITNMRTNETLTTNTTEEGYYSVNLNTLIYGYLDGDTINVSAIDELFDKGYEAAQNNYAERGWWIGGGLLPNGEGRSNPQLEDDNNGQSAQNGDSDDGDLARKTCL